MTNDTQAVALDLAARGWHVFPLAPDSKRPLANCMGCADNRCGGPGCGCSVGWCHAHHSATTDPEAIGQRFPARSLVGVATEPSGLCVVDVEGDGVPWMRDAIERGTLTPTTAYRSASGTGFHLYYRGVVRSRLRPGGEALDIKSAGAYVRWTGQVAADRPEAEVPAALVSWLDSTAAPKVRRGTTPGVPHSMAPASVVGAECPHRSPVFLERGISMAVGRIESATERVHNTVYAAFLAVLSKHGKCGCLTNAHAERLFAAAEAKGETRRHCSDAWNNARAELGLK